MNAGTRLREERERLKLSQAELADKVGISRVTLGRYETGKREIGTDFLDKVGRLGMQVEYILTGIKVEGNVKQIRALWKVLFAMAKQLQIDSVFIKIAVEIAGEDVDTEARLQSDKLISDILNDSPALILNTNLFIETFEAVERAQEKKSNGFLSSWKKAQLVLLVYRASKKSGKVDTKVLDDALLLTDPSSLSPHLQDMTDPEYFEQASCRLRNLGRFPKPDKSNGDD